MYSKLTKFLCFSDRVTSPLSHILLILFSLGFSANCIGQEAHNYARVELKSGIVIEGKVVKIEYQKQVDLLINQSDTMEVPWDDIASLKFIDTEIKKRAEQLVKPRKPNVPFSNSGNYFQFDFGIPLGRDYWGDLVAGGAVSIGYGKTFNYQHNLGVTLGYEGYLWPDITVLPVGLEYFGRLKEQDRSWFYFFGTGYGFPHVSEYDWNDNSKLTGGMFFNPGLGITNKRHATRSWYLKFGYKYQSFKSEYDGYVWEFQSQRPARIKENIFYHRVDIRLGFRFD